MAPPHLAGDAAAARPAAGRARAGCRLRQRPDDIDYRALDATNERAFADLADGSFDAAIAAMLLMDLADVDPLMRTVARLLRPSGRFVFSVVHPCFNNPSAVHVGETEDREGTLGQS
jgi:SAM-dependent methyltransferase